MSHDREARSGWVRALVTCGLLVVLASWWGPVARADGDAAAADLTMETFGRITMGMSLADVERVVGRAGRLTPETDETAAPGKRTYVWERTPCCGSISVSFREDRVVTKMQAGLDDEARRPAPDLSARLGQVVGSGIALVLVGWFVFRMLTSGATRPAPAPLQPLSGTPPAPPAPRPVTPAPDAIRPELAAAFDDLERAMEEFDTLADESLDFETDVVGESFDGRQQHIRAITARVEHYDPRTGARFLARLVPEPTNPYDAQAVAVTDAESGAHLGYLSRTLAKRYQPAVSASANAVVPAIVRGDRDLGVCLDLTQFNAGAGLRSPEDILADAGTYFERRAKAGDVDGVDWKTHRQLALEAASLSQHEAAAESFDKAMRGWLAVLAFDGKAPNAVLFEEYTRWCRKAKRPDLEITVLRTYINNAEAQDAGSTRWTRMQQRLASLTGPMADEAPF